MDYFIIIIIIIIITILSNHKNEITESLVCIRQSELQTGNLKLLILIIFFLESPDL